MKNSRLFQIIYHLLDKGHTTAPELAEKLEVSTRTIYRDIDALSSAGIPVYAETGRKGGIYLLHDFTLDKVVLSEKEKQEILAALKSLPRISNPCGEHTLSKLSALFQVHTENWYELDFSRWGTSPQNNELFECLKSAVIHHRCVQITYASFHKNGRERKIFPLKMLYKSGAWYVKSYCTEAEDFRVFKLNRIIKYCLLEETFKPISFPFQDTPLPFPKYYDLTLRFTEEFAYRVFDEFDAEQITVQENGSLIVSARIPDTPRTLGWLLSFGTAMEVIEPAYLREDLSRLAKKVYEKNKP